MGKKRSAKSRDDFNEEWCNAVAQRHQGVRARDKPVRVREAKKQDAASQTHLRDAVLLQVEIARDALGGHYSPSLVAVPLATLLRALAKDELG